MLLLGGFGAGKTTFTQGIGQGLGLRERVVSPSFALVNQYCVTKDGRRFDVYHLDVYRVASADEALAFGLEEYLDGHSVAVIEWADNVAAALPVECLSIALESATGNCRSIVFVACGERPTTLLSTFEAALGAVCVPESRHARAVSMH